jgi:hypothetical protein
MLKLAGRVLLALFLPPLLPPAAAMVVTRLGEPAGAVPSALGEPHRVSAQEV